MGWASHLDGVYLGQDTAPQTAAEAVEAASTDLISPNGNEITSVAAGQRGVRLMGLPITPLLVAVAAAAITYFIIRQKK